MRYLSVVVLLAGCAAPQAEAPYDGYAWHGKIGEGARVFGSPAASEAAFRNDEEGCEWVVLRQPKDDRELLFQRCMALRGWLPIRLPR